MCLSDKHIESAGIGNIQIFCVIQNRRKRGIVYEVKHSAKIFKTAYINNFFSVIRVHTDRRCVDYHLSRRANVIDILIIHFSASRKKNHFFCAEVAKHRFHRERSAARAEYKADFIFNLHPAFFYHIRKAEVIRIIAEKRAVFFYGYCIYAADFFCRGRKSRAVFYNVFFVRNCNIKSAEIFFFKKSVKLLRFFFKKQIFIIAKLCVNFG